MNGYAYDEIFSAEDRAAMELAAAVVAWLPERHPAGGERIRCHEVARIAGAIVAPAAKVIDGEYKGPHRLGIEHSWVQLSDNVILDPYCVGRVPPVALIQAPWQTAHWVIYRAGKGNRDDIRADIVDMYVKAWADRQRTMRLKYVELDGLFVSAAWVGESRMHVTIRPPKPCQVYFGGDGAELSMVPIALTEIGVRLQTLEEWPGKVWIGVEPGRPHLGDLSRAFERMGRYRELFIFADELELGHHLNDESIRLMLDVQAERGVVRVMRSTSYIPYGFCEPGTDDANRFGKAILRARALREGFKDLPRVAILRGVVNDGVTDWNRIFPMVFSDGQWKAFNDEKIGLLPWFKSVLLPPREGDEG